MSARDRTAHSGVLRTRTLMSDKTLKIVNEWIAEQGWMDWPPATDEEPASPADQKGQAPGGRL